MKRFLAVFLALLCCLSFCACKEKNKEIVEIAINSENWSQYFETGFTQDYFENNLGEVTHMNCSAGIRLKDEHQIVLDNESYKTKVDFEAELISQFAEVHFDFEKGSCEVVDANKGGTPKTTTKSATFTTEAFKTNTDKFPATGAVAIGDVWQGTKEGSEVELKYISSINKILSANGQLYLYQ